MVNLDDSNLREAQDLTVLDAEGQPVAVHQLWAESPVVIGFVRHFG